MGMSSRATDLVQVHILVLLLTILLKKLWMNECLIILGMGRTWDKNNQLDFAGHKHSDLGSGMLILLCLFAVCEIVHCNADDFSDEPDFNIVCQFKIVN